MLTKLDILGPGLSHLSVEAQYNFVVRNAPLLVTDRQVRRRRMEAIDRYLDAYKQILQLRDAVTNIAQMARGAPLPEPPLTGAPPLCGERVVDLQGALPLFDAAHHRQRQCPMVDGIKGAPLAGDFDARIRRAVDAATIDIAMPTCGARSRRRAVNNRANRHGFRVRASTRRLPTQTRRTATR